MKHKYGTRGDLISCPYKEELQKYKQFVENVKNLNFHNTPIPQTSETFSKFHKKQDKLKQLIEELK